MPKRCDLERRLRYTCVLVHAETIRRDTKFYCKTTTNRAKRWLWWWKLLHLRWAPQQQQKKEERRWEVGGGRGESGESSEVHERPSVTLTAPEARSRSRGVATLDEAPRMSLRMSSKLPTLAPSSLSLVITALARTSAYPSTTVVTNSQDWTLRHFLTERYRNWISRCLDVSPSWFRHLEYLGYGRSNNEFCSEEGQTPIFDPLPRNEKLCGNL